MCHGTVGKPLAETVSTSTASSLHHCTGKKTHEDPEISSHRAPFCFHVFGTCRRRMPRIQRAKTRRPDGCPSGIRPWPVGVFRRSAWLRKSASAARAVGGTPWAGGTQLAATSAFPFNILFGHADGDRRGVRSSRRVASERPRSSVSLCTCRSTRFLGVRCRHGPSC